MKVDNPRFDEFGDVDKCIDCPWDGKYTTAICPYKCPTNRNYVEQCRLAEQANKGEGK